MNRTLARTLPAVALALCLTGGARAQAPGKQEPQSFSKQIVRTVELKYLLYLPADYGKDPAKRWPLMLFLHGSGESGDDLEKVKVHGPPKLIAAGKEFPFIVVSPQCPSPRVGWDVETLTALLDDLQARLAVDPDRVYLTGLSMGGFGTWALAEAHPDRFAAIVPICGGGDPTRARRLRNVPAWVFHGAKDPVVPIKFSQDMVDALKATGDEVKFTIEPEAGHDSWTEAYNTPELYDWLLHHRRAQPPAAK